MEVFYAFGILCIKALQDRLVDMEWLINFLNQIFNPNYLLEYVFPVTAALDSVFGAQLMLTMAFGGWINTMCKWILVEDRPFWWVRETNYYGNSDRPILYQNSYTCETGPGSPSGHCAAAASMFMLAEMWISHVIRDMRLSRIAALHEKFPMKSFFIGMMSLIGLARMYVGAHFPHQCLMGTMIGSFVSPSLCLFITDPFLLRSGDSQDSQHSVTRHVLMAFGAIALSILLGVAYLIAGVDLHWSTRLAFRWCQSADFIHVKSSPVFALVQSTGSLLGWALAVTPEVSKYRHNTRRNSVIAILLASLTMYFFIHVQDFIPNRRIPFYAAHFFLNLVRPFVFLRLIPKVALFTYTGPRIEYQENRSATVRR